MYIWGIIGIIAWIVIAFLPARWAQKKGYSFFLFLLLSWFVSFVVTLVIIAFLNDKNETPESRAIDAEVEKIKENEAK